MPFRNGAMRPGYTALVLVFAMTLAVVSVLAAPGVDYSRQGHWRSALALPVEPSWPEDSSRLIVNGDVVYLSGLAYSRWSERQYAIDCADPARPVVTDSLFILHSDVAKSGDFLFVASGDRMNVVSLADARHPRLVSHLGLDVRADNIRINDGLAYVGSNMENEQASAVVVDVSDPYHPLLLGAFEQKWGIRILEFAGHIGFMAAKDDLRIVDLSDPLRPVPIGIIDQPGTLHDMKVIGNLGIVVRDDGVYLLGLDDPARPTRLASIKWPAHVYEQRIHVADGLLFVSHLCGAVGWDITRPDQPVELGEIPLANGFRGLGLGTGRVYMASADNGLPLTISTMDLTSRDLVRPEEMIRIPSANSDFDIEGDLMVSMLNTNLTVTDISDPTAAIEVGRLDLGGWDTAVADIDGALAAVWSYTGFRIIDFSDPAAPVARGLMPSVDVHPDAAGLRGNLGITVTSAYPGPNELAVYDLGDPDLPVRIGSLALPHGNEELLVAGDLVVCRSPGAVTICDISQPANPQLTSITYGSWIGIGLSGDDLYVGRVQGGFRVYDISDPSLPRQCGFFRTLGLTDRFEFDGDIVYASDFLGGCQVIDMSDPASPVWVGSLLNPVINDMKVHRDWIHFGGTAAPRHVSVASRVPAPRVSGVSLAATVHPNPFNPVTIVGFELEARHSVRVSVYDVAGRRLATVADAVFESGHHTVRWDGEVDGGLAAPAGTYFFAVEAGGARQTVKAALIK